MSLTLYKDIKYYISFLWSGCTNQGEVGADIPAKLTKKVSLGYIITKQNWHNARALQAL